MLSIEIITDKHLDMLQTFCQECDKLGYQNNSSLQSMKLLWCKQTGEYWCAVDNNKIVAVAGAHPLPEVGDHAWRILFRGCELPYSDNFKGLGKAQWNSITFREFVPKFIDWCPSNELYITTNVDHEHSNGKASRNHRTMQLMARQNILDNCGDIVLYYTNQTLWKLNVEEYLQRRERIQNNYVV